MYVSATGYTRRALPCSGITVSQSCEVEVVLRRRAWSMEPLEYYLFHFAVNSNFGTNTAQRYL